MKEYKHINSLKELSYDDMEEYEAYFNYINGDKTEIIEKFENPENKKYFEFLQIIDFIESEIRWAVMAFKLTDFEETRFRSCLNFCLKEYNGWYPAKKKRNCYPDPNCLEGMNPENMLLLIAIYRIYYSRMLEYADYFIPKEYLSINYPETITGLGLISDELELLQKIDLQKRKDSTNGELMAKYSKENKRLISFLENAEEVTLKIKNDSISYISIHAKDIGTYKVSDSFLEDLNESRNEGDIFLSKIDNGVIYTKKEDFENLKQVFQNHMFIPNDDPNFSFGKQRTSLTEEICHSLYPLYLCLSERFKIQSPERFGKYTNRDFYKYIIDLLDIPNAMADEYKLETYLKKHNNPQYLYPGCIIPSK